MKVTVRLSMTEIILAAVAGVIRNVTCIKEGLANRKYTDDDVSDWQVHIIGSCAECAVAKHLNVYWGGSNRSFKKPDVGDLQVRATGHPDGHLILRERDVKDETFILAIVRLPFVDIVGATQTWAGKQDKYWRADKNAWWVPQADLAPP